MNLLANYTNLNFEVNKMHFRLIWVRFSIQEPINSLDQHVFIKTRMRQSNRNQIISGAWAIPNNFT